MNSHFSSHANNFISALQTGVDPRTGQFSVNLPLATLTGNNLLGPELTLGLHYSPLNNESSGFGCGFSLGITRFHNSTNLLELSNGERYRVAPGTDTVRNQKLSNFRFAYTNGRNDTQGYTLFWKEGKREFLTVREDGETFVTTTIESPVGHALRLSWAWSGQYPLLTQVDDEITTLCRVVYGTFTQVTIWPGSADEYQMVLELSDPDSRLTAVRQQISTTETLDWYFSYDAVGPGYNNLLLTGVSYPTGMEERVTYNQMEGLRFPEASGMGWLPAAVSHTILPGSGQPATVKYYDYTAQNFLGYNSNFGDWSSDSDYLYTTLTDYTYGSTETVSDGSDTLTTTRRYNNYHLQVSEEITRQGCTYRTDFRYYAEENVFIDGQPPQFQLPREKKEIWIRNSSGETRTQTTLTEFDESGNPLREVAPDGTETLTTWYAAKGEAGCPPEAEGFVRFIKSQTVIPRETAYDAPAMRTLFTYGLLSDNSQHIVQTGQSLYAGDILLTERVFSYNKRSAEAEYGRITDITDTKYTAGAAASFTSQQTFSTTANKGVLRQILTFVGHDGLTTTTVRQQSALSALLLSETDVQDVTTDYRYDRNGRILTRTLAPGTAYQNITTWTYAIETDGPVTTEMDASGNRLRTRFDGAGREISQQRYDTDSTQQWYETATKTYDTFGESVAGSGSDWLTGNAAEHYKVNAVIRFDGWGMACVRRFSDGTEKHQFADPVTLTRTQYVTGESNGQRLETDRLTIVLDDVSQLPVTETRTDGVSGQDKGVRTFSWDGARRLRRETDELGNTTLYTYDAYGRVVTQTLPDGSQVARTYAPHLTGGQVSRISITGSDAYGVIQTWQIGTQEFDSLGRVTRRTVGGRLTRYTYNAAAPVPSLVTPASGTILKYTWVAELGNVLSHATGDGVNQAFTHDRVTGALLTAQENNDTVNSHVWTASGNLQEEKFTRESDSRKASYNWTLVGMPRRYTDITDSQTVYGRDEYGRVTTITDEALSATLHYDAVGRLVRQDVTGSTSQDRLSTALEYDGSGREITRTVTDSRSGATLLVSQGWLDNGLLAFRTLQQNGVTARDEVYGYDVRNRLTSYAVSGDSPPVDASGQTMSGQTYRYDALNNLSTVTTTLSDGGKDIATYHYENVNDPTQLTSVTHSHDAYPGAIPLAYDADGRMILDEAGRTLSYDATGRLTGVSGEGISGGHYGYDALDQLVSQIVSDGDRRQLYYRADELVNEVQVEQNRSSRLIKQGHCCLGVSDGNDLTLTAGDHNDSLLWSRYGSQTEGKVHVWSPYGQGESTDLLPGFNGERADPVSGTYHLGNGYRAYNPVLMRFNCPDSLSPFGAGGINPYAYCAGDPVNNTDPSGHISTAGWVGIGLGVTGILLSVVTAGASIAAAGSIAAAWAAASTTALVVGGLGLAADAAAISSGALEDADPKASSALGWVSIGLGIVGAAAGLGFAGRGLEKVAAGTRWRTLENSESIEMSARAGAVAAPQWASGGLSSRNMTSILDLPDDMIREIGRYLPLEDLQSFRRTASRFSEAITTMDVVRKYQARQKRIKEMMSFQIPFRRGEVTVVTNQVVPPEAARLIERRIRAEAFILQYGTSGVPNREFGYMMKSILDEYKTLHNMNDLQVMGLISIERRWAATLSL